ncbi:hypothetical protein UP84_14935, partial [Escherichia coli]
MIWQPEFTDKTLSRKPGAVHLVLFSPGQCFSVNFRSHTGANLGKQGLSSIPLPEPTTPIHTPY